jgi:S1-C subfamily serine protease
MSEPSSTSPRPRCVRPVLFALAVVFAASTILYTTLWMIAKRSAPDVDLGFDHSPFLVVTAVQPNSPAEKAGLLPGDRILAVDGTSLQGANSLYGLYRPPKPGNTVHLTIARPSQTSPIVLTAMFRQ